MSDEYATRAKPKQQAPTAGPSADDRYGSGPVGENVVARVVTFKTVKGRTEMTLSRGEAHGVHRGMSGYIPVGNERYLFQVHATSPAFSFAFTELEAGKLANSKAVINPVGTGPGNVYPPRVIAVSVEAGRTKITISRGIDQGVVPGMRGTLSATNGQRGATLTIDSVEARRSYAYVENTVDHVKDHMIVILSDAAGSKRRPVQRRATGAPSTTSIQAAARAGVANARGPLPHFDAIQRAFGKHDVSRVQTAVGGAATAAAQSLGARAYAMGNQIAFDTAPDLHTAAHEAAHTIQQAHGVGFDGLGAADGGHERQADAVADAVVAGRSAEALLDEITTMGDRGDVVQRKPADRDAGEILEHGIPGGAGKLPAKQGPGPVGDPYIDHGPACEGADHPECFLTPEQRTRLIARIEARVAKAGTNFLFALEEVRVSKLLENEADLPWVASLLLDLAATFMIGKVAAVLVRLKQTQAKDLAKRMGDLVERHLPLPSPTWGGRIEQALVRTSDESIKSGVKSAVDGAKKQAKQYATNDASKTRKQDALAYFAQLQQAADSAYVKLRESFPATSSDAELLALNESFALEHHHIAAYKVAIKAKLERFERSKTGKIGRREESSMSGIAMRRDLSVIWLQSASGAPPQLAYRHIDRPITMQGQRLGRDEPDRLPMKLDRSFSRTGATDQPGALQIVPSEFVEVAVLRHQAMWGEPPQVEIVDDRPAKTPAASASRPDAHAGPKAPAAPVVIPDVFKVDPATGKQRTP